MKIVLWIIGALALLAIGAGAGFVEGKTYQSNQANQIRSQFLRARGLTPNGSDAAGANTSGGTGAGFGGGFGGGVAGQIKSVQGNTIELNTANNNVTTVDLTANTRIEKSSQGTAADLKTGEQLVVRGQSDANGTVTANQIQIVSNGSPQSGAPQSTPAAP